MSASKNSTFDWLYDYLQVQFGSKYLTSRQELPKWLARSLLLLDDEMFVIVIGRQVQINTHLWSFDSWNYFKHKCWVCTKETALRKSEENSWSRCWRFLADRIIIFDYAREADRITIYWQTWFFHLTFSKFFTSVCIWNE